MRDEVIYQCVNMSCARSLPRRVNYCPYCGINQSTALPRAVEGRGHASDASPAAQTMQSAHVSAVAAARERVSMAKPTPAATLSGAAPNAPIDAGAAVPPPPSPSPGVSAAPPTAATPPRRRPIQLRWWLLALGALWLIWISQRPSTARLDARVDKAVALAQACKSNEAQAELIALRKTAATAQQLARLQAALDDADAACRRGARSKAPVKSSARPAAQPSQSVRNLVADARASMARGDYRAAADKMEVCVAMVDANTRECVDLKARAERLDGEMRRCLAQGADWVDARCQ